MRLAVQEGSIVLYALLQLILYFLLLLCTKSSFSALSILVMSSIRMA